MDPLEDDKDFLLRCALTYNWDILIQFCSRLMEVFNTSVRDRDIARHKQRVEAAGHQLLARDEWGNNPLHAACYNNPPVMVVKSILECASAASLQIHLMVTRDLSTPLNIACATGASTAIIQALLNPPAGLERGGIAVGIPDARGCTPLSELTIHYELKRKSPYYCRTALPLDQVQLISTAAVPAYASASGAGSRDDYNENLTYGHGNHHTNFNGHSTDSSSMEPLLESFWTKVEMLLRAAWTTSISDPWISIIHATALVAESCPPVLTSLICRCYPAMVSFENRKGVLPLHLAIQNMQWNVIREAGTPNMTLPYPDYAILPMTQRRCTVIEKLVSIYPTAVQKPFPATDRSVFCQAIANGLLWHVRTSISTSSITNTSTMSDSKKNGTVNTTTAAATRRRTSTSSGTSSSRQNNNHSQQQYEQEESQRRRRQEQQEQQHAGPLQHLWNHDREALSIPDVTTGLYPFLLAATCAMPSTTISSFSNNHDEDDDDKNNKNNKNNNPNNTFNERDIGQLDTIYSLLRLHPQLLENIIDSPQEQQQRFHHLMSQTMWGKF